SAMRKTAAAGRPVPFASRLLAPTLRKERAKARQPAGVLRPTIGGSPRKEGGVYHILAAQGQTQFRRGEETEHLRRRAGFARRRLANFGVELAAAVRGAVRRLDQPCRAACRDCRGNLLEAGGKVPRPPRKPEPAQKSFQQQRFDLVGEVGQGPQLGLRGAREEALLRRRLDRGAVGGDPETAAGQLAREVRDHDAIGSRDETDQLRLVHHLSRDDVAPFPGRFGEGLSLGGGGSHRGAPSYRSSRRKPGSKLSLRKCEIAEPPRNVAAAW